MCRERSAAAGAGTARAARVLWVEGIALYATTPRRGSQPPGASRRTSGGTSTTSVAGPQRGSVAADYSAAGAPPAGHSVGNQAARAGLRKPHWLPDAAWTELLKKVAYDPRCAVTGDPESLVVDHILPGYVGGTDDGTNLQFLRADLNAKKGPQPDAYWGGTFYFDQMPVLTSLRTAQRREAWERILEHGALWDGNTLAVSGGAL